MFELQLRICLHPPHLRSWHVATLLRHQVHAHHMSYQIFFGMNLNHTAIKHTNSCDSLMLHIQRRWTTLLETNQLHTALCI